MTTQARIRRRWESERPLYDALGHYVTELVCEKLAESHAVDDFLKIRPRPRTKQTDSLIAKALYRGKEYADPYGDITDKVGVRFVVLTTDEIEVLKNIIEGYEAWVAELSRDFQQEQEQRPRVFDYASVHYVVALRKEVAYRGVTIPVGIPCEIQIRTLMQHACSELTHDAMYKTDKKVSPRAERACAKAIALAEATNDFFLKTREELKDLNKDKDTFLARLDALYEQYVGIPPSHTRLRDPVYNALAGSSGPDALAQIETLLKEEGDELAADVREGREFSLLYEDSIVLLIYHVLMKAPAATIRNWPLLPEELGPFATYAGVSLAP